MGGVAVEVSRLVPAKPPKSVLGPIWWASRAELLSNSRKDGGANVGTTADVEAGAGRGAPVSRSSCPDGTGLNRLSGSSTTAGVGLVAIENKSCPNWLNLAKLVEVL